MLRRYRQIKKKISAMVIKKSFWKSTVMSLRFIHLIRLSEIKDILLVSITVLFHTLNTEKLHMLMIFYSSF